MSIMWYNEKHKDLIATIAKNNITLNKPALDCIPDAYNVMLGISDDEKLVYIKALNKELSIRGDIPETDRYTITLRSSYARVSNKDFIKLISKMCNIDFTEPKNILQSLMKRNTHLLLILIRR